MKCDRDNVCNKKNMLLYAVTDRRWLGGSTLYRQVEQALAGGTTFLQLREKELGEDDFLEEARTIGELCHRYQVPFVVNDRVELAVRAGADGVHVGQSDMGAEDVRRRLGPDKIIGVSVHTVEEAVLAQRMGADYLGAGAVFPTGSKADAQKLSHDMLREICEAVEIPVVAIGGIGKENVMELAGSGISGIAVVSALFAESDIQAAAAKLRELAEKIVGKA